MTATLHSESVPLAQTEPTVALRRRTIDTLLTAGGAVFAVVLFIAGGLLMWGSNFAEDYVYDELSSQNIVFPDAAALEEDGRTDLVQYAGETVDTGAEAEAYASFIDGHLEGIADGQTYADLGGPERAANAAVEEAIASGAPASEVEALEADAAAITGQRNTLFKGETLRGLLLSAFAWSTVGRIAGIAGIVALVAGAVMVVARRPRRPPPPQGGRQRAVAAQRSSPSEGQPTGCPSVASGSATRRQRVASTPVSQGRRLGGALALARGGAGGRHRRLRDPRLRLARRRATRPSPRSRRSGSARCEPCRTPARCSRWC